MSFGTRLKARREQLGITQPQLAEMLGVSKGAIGNYETDANSPKATILFKVFDVLKCDANYLFQDGDILLVEATREIEIGDIGIFQINNECFVKKLGEKELISLNKDYKNIPLDETAATLGKVIGKL